LEYIIEHVAIDCALKRHANIMRVLSSVITKTKY